MALGDLHERLAPAGPRSPFRAADRVGMARPNGRARLHGVMTMTNLRRVGRRNLSVTAIGLQVQRDRCALVTRWQDVTGVNRRRHQLLLPVEELRLSDSELLEPSSTGKPMRLPASLPGDRATRRIHIRPLRQELAHGTDRRPTSQPGITSV